MRPLPVVIGPRRTARAKVVRTLLADPGNADPRGALPRDARLNRSWSIEERMMKTYRTMRAKLQSYTNPASLQQGKMGYILLWLLGIPIPVLLVIFLLRGCQ